VKIRGGEAEEMVAGIQEGVLPSEIGCHAVFVVLPVELDDQPDVWVIEVGSGKKPPSPVMQLDLKLWCRKPRANELHAETALHRRFGTRVGETDRASESSDSLGACALLDVTVQCVHVDQAGVERQVNGDNGLNEIAAAPQIGHRPYRVGHLETTPLNNVASLERRSSQFHPRSTANRDAARNGYLDRIARRHVEAENPGGGPA
jgi:hypothetical protein